MAYPRLKRKRTKMGVRPTGYTGLNPVVRPERPQRGARPPTSRKSTTTGEAPKSGSSSQLLTGVLAGKEAGETLGEAYNDGQKVQEGILSGWDTAKEVASDAWTGMNDWMNGTTTLTNLNQFPDKGAEIMNQFGGSTADRWFNPLESSMTMTNPTDAHGLYHTGIELSPNTIDPIDDAVLGGGTKFTETGQSIPGMQTGWGNMPNATFGNAVTGLGNAYALGSGIAEGNYGQAVGGGIGLAMMTNPATLPFAWLPALAGGLLDDWI